MYIVAHGGIMRFIDKFDVLSGRTVEKICGILERGAARQSGNLLEHEAYELFSEVGIAVPTFRILRSGDDPATLSSSLSGDKRYVMKIVAEKIIHKTDVGGLRFGLSAGDVSSAASDMLNKFKKDDPYGVMVVEEISYRKGLGSELLLGVYQDEFFGPTAAIGFGGTATERYKEIMKDGAAQIFFPASVECDEFNEILKRHPVIEHLEGKVRGFEKRISFAEVKKAYDAVRSLGLVFSHMNPDVPFVIEEIDINPAVVSDGRLIALDGVVRVSKNMRKKIFAKPIEKIGKLLSPSSVAMAGVSGKNPSNPANIILSCFINSGMRKEDIFLIHPKEEEISGIKCVRSVEEMLAMRGGRPVDCMVVGVPARIAGPLTMEAMSLSAAQSYQIISAGFGETEAGKGIQKELENKIESLSSDPARRPVVNGPNTVGNICGKISTIFTPGHKSSRTGRGAKNAALLCQSGAFMITRMSDFADMISPSVAVSVGNQMDLSVVDFLEFLIEDKHIDCYGLYIEGLKPGEGLRLMRLLDRARLAGKHVVLYKSGRTKEGADAAKGHTAAMAGDYGMFSSFTKISGAMLADRSDDFGSLMMLGVHLKNISQVHKKEKIGIAALSNAGFEKCSMADNFSEHSHGRLKVASISDSTKKNLEEILSSIGVSGLIDQSDILDLSPMIGDDPFEKICRTVLSDEAVDIALFSLVPETVVLDTLEKGEGHGEDFRSPGSIISRFIAMKKECRKPFVVSISSGWKYDAAAAALKEAGIPTFRNADIASRILAQFLASK